MEGVEADQARLRVPFAALARATNNFSMDRKIGEGATGEVFRGALGGVPVAVKCLKLLVGAAPAVQAAAARRFFAESGVVLKFKSHRIVQLLAWAANDDPAAASPYALAFELLEGGSLLGEHADNVRIPHAGGDVQWREATTARSRILVCATVDEVAHHFRVAGAPASYVQRGASVLACCRHRNCSVPWRGLDAEVHRDRLFS